MSTNGALGHIRRIDYGIHINDPNNRRPSRIWIEFINDRSGKTSRQKSVILMNRLSVPLSWTPIVPYTVVIPRRPALGNLQVLRTQFPILPAEALTVHKSQGGTYDNVVLYSSGRRIQRFLLYVACSRATFLSGLTIVGQFEPNKKKVTNKAILVENWNDMRLYCSLLCSVSYMKQELVIRCN